jgi:hydroxyacid-oxoacid transhydrogenase
LMQDTASPNGLSALGYGDADIASIVDGAMKQQRLLACSPRDVSVADLTAIVQSSMQHW